MPSAQSAPVDVKAPVDMALTIRRIWHFPPVNAILRASSRSRSHLRRSPVSLEPTGKQQVHLLRETKTAAKTAATLVNRPLAVAVVGVGATVVLTMW